MTIALHASTPSAVRSTSASTTAAVTTDAFSPPADSLLVAVVVAEYAARKTPAPTMAISDSAGGAWTLRANGSQTNFFSQVSVWTRYLSSAPGSITVTGDCGATTGTSTSIAVGVLTGADPTQTGAVTLGTASTTSSATEQSLTLASGSWAYFGVAVGNLSTLVADANTTSIDVWGDASNGSTNGIGRTTTESAGGATTLGWTGVGGAVDIAWAGVEILVASAGPSAGQLRVPIQTIQVP